MPQLEQSVLNALVDAVVKVFWTKQDMRRLLESSGVPRDWIAGEDWTQYKRSILAPIIDKLNQWEKGEAVLDRLIHEVCSYSHCDHLLRWEDGVAKKADAEVALEHLRTAVAWRTQAKRDKALDREIRERQRAENARGQAMASERERIKQEFYRYLGDPNRQAAGIGLEVVLYDLFRLYELRPRSPFRRTGEQIDGAFELNGDHFLLEAKWQSDPVNLQALRDLDGAVSSSLDNTLGLFISVNGFSAVGIEQYLKGSRPRLICMYGGDLVAVLDGRIELRDLLVRKKDLAVDQQRIFIPVDVILTGKF